MRRATRAAPAAAPYVVAQWVRGDRFYGRHRLLAKLLDGPRNTVWLLGTRRIGKTSILKQLEHLAVTAESPRYLPIFWDVQGSETSEHLHEGFRDALLDAADRLEALSIPLAGVDDADLFHALGRLRRELRRRDLTLLLLADEAEELLTIHRTEPGFLSRLRRALQSTEGIRTVLASTLRLFDLASERSGTSPFLDGFTPPLVVGGLGDEAARALLRQDGLPGPSRPVIDARAVERLRGRANNHPYLLQLLGERYAESASLEAAVESIADDEMVRFFFGVDLAMLPAGDRELLRAIESVRPASATAIGAHTGFTAGEVGESLRRLERLGFVDGSAGGELRLANYFFRRWFAETDGAAGPATASTAPPADSLDRDSAPTRPPPAPHPGPPRALAELPATERLATVTGKERIDDRYELLQLLGFGSSGEVYKARDTLLDTVVALKVLRGDALGDRDAVARLRREVVLARDLSHPNVLKVYHLGDARGQRYLTMQYVDGCDLALVLAGEAPLELRRALTLAAQLAGALGALHSRGVLHRDVKPSNVLIDREGVPRLTDFGLARLESGPGITRTGLFLGTPAYASPEQAMGEPLDSRSDLYSLGVVIFEMLTGQRPFSAGTPQEMLVAQAEAPPPVPSDIVSTLPDEISEIVLRCLAKEREERFADASELARALTAAGGG